MSRNESATENGPAERAEVLRRATGSATAKRRTALHRRLAQTLFSILSGMILLLSAGVYYVGHRMAQDADSLAAMPVLAQLSSEIATTAKKLDVQQLLSITARALEVLQGARVYLVELDGRVAADLSLQTARAHRETVDTSPLELFVDHPDQRTIPAFMGDPGDPTERALFIATRTQIESREYYLVAVLSDLLIQRNTIYALDRFLGPYVIAVIAGLLFIGYLSSKVIFSVMTRRLSSLLAVVESYREGDFRQRTAVSGNDELTGLTESVNQMAERIEEQVSALEHRDNLRRELIASVSHDLRGPVGVLRLCAEQINRSPAMHDHPELAERCKVLERSTESLATLLTQLFELAKLEAREASPNLEPFPIDELLVELTENYRERAASKGVVLSAELPPETIEVWCDSQLIERVLTNLMSNAITYTPSGGSITVTAQPSDETCRIAVRDTGLGIPEEDVPFVFDRSYRVQQDADRETSSGGLGLAIVKRILESHGATIHLESRRNEGSCFWFELRRAAQSRSVNSR